MTPAIIAAKSGHIKNWPLRTIQIAVATTGAKSVNVDGRVTEYSPFRIRYLILSGMSTNRLLWKNRSTRTELSLKKNIPPNRYFESVTFAGIETKK